MQAWVEVDQIWIISAAMQRAISIVWEKVVNALDVAQKHWTGVSIEREIHS